MPEPQANPQQDQRSSASMADFAKMVRGSVDIPSNVSDEEIVRTMMSAPKEARQAVGAPESVVEPRRRMKEEQPGMLDRFTQGMAAVPTDIVKTMTDPATYKKASENIARPPQQQIKEWGKDRPPASTLFDIPNIKKDYQSGNVAGAAGRATTQGLMWGTMAKGLKPEPKPTLGEMEAIGEQRSGNWARDAARTTMRPQAKMLESQITDIKASMQHETIDSAKLGADVAYAKKVVAKARKVAGAQVKDVSAADEAVDRLNAKIKTNPKMMGWNDAHDALKEISAAKQALGKNPSAIKNALTEIEDGLKKGLQEGADKAGQGKAYSRFTSNWRSLKNLEEAGAKTFRGQTSAQATGKLTSKGGVAGIRIPRVGSVQLGPDKEAAIAGVNKKALAKWHRAVGELDKRIREGQSPESDIEQARRQR